MPYEQKPCRFPRRPSLKSVITIGGCSSDYNYGKFRALPEPLPAAGPEELAQYRKMVANYDVSGDMVAEDDTPQYLFLAAIAFSLRRNISLQSVVPTLANLLPDKAFGDAIAVPRAADGMHAIDPASE